MEQILQPKEREIYKKHDEICEKFKELWKEQQAAAKWRKPSKMRVVRVLAREYGYTDQNVYHILVKYGIYNQ